MKKAIVALSVLAGAFAMSAPAHAALVTTVSVAGIMNNSFGATEATFDNILSPPQPAPQPYGSIGAFGDFNDNGGAFSGFGMIMKNPGQDSLGLYAEPLGDTTNYLTVQPAGSPEKIVLNGLYSKFELSWGSIDNYNSIDFLKNGTSLLLSPITGADVAPLIPGPLNQTKSDTNRYVQFVFNAGETFDTIVLTSVGGPSGLGRSFEMDNLAWACAPGGGACAPDIANTPLPAALPLFVSELGGLGFLGFWRKKKKTLKMAAA